MLVRILLFIAEVAGDVLAGLLLARFLLQLLRASFRNPIGQFIVAATDWVVRPARRIVPGFGGLDLASLLLAWLVQAAYFVLVFSLSAQGPFAFPLGGVLVAGLFEVARICIHIGMLVVLVSAILSWVNPYAPLAPFFDSLARPLLAPIRRFLPPIGGVDLSPLVLLLLMQILLMTLDGMRASAVGLLV